MQVHSTQLGTAGAMPKAPQTDIESEVSRASRTVEDVWQAVSLLGKSLNPVLRPEGNGECAQTPDVITTCPLGENIRAVTYRAEEALRYLHSIQSRLAV